MDAVLAATAPDNPAGRTVQQLIEYRLMPKWDRYYSSQDQAGPIEKPVGVLVTMLRRDAECGDQRCDERTDVDTGEACRSCGQRREDRRAEQPGEEGADGFVPQQRGEPAVAVQRRAKCPECHRPLRNSTEDAVCSDCREDVTA